MKPTSADLSKLGGGEPHDVGALGLHEHRPSPPIDRAASMAAIVFAGRSPGVVTNAVSAASITGEPVRTFPWIA
jgi:hypothetical protein